ncbi:MAG: response regulator [Candidatus Aminicenantes bacterium]|nr:response regulator [Candidatus Aminicenantes bacterium]
MSFVLSALDPQKKITQYTVKKWDMAAGLPGNSVFAILQTGNGYLWVGTRDGLARFDGFDFELYNKERISQFKDNDIRALYEDQNDVLWIGTDSGGLIRYKAGEFFTYPAAGHKTLDKIKVISEDRWGNLWIGSSNAGLTCLRHGEFITYIDKEDSPGNEVRAILKDKKEDLWVTTETGIFKIVEPGVFRPYAQELSPYYKSVSLYDGDTGELWVGTGGKHLFRLKNGKLTSYGDEEGFTYPAINCLYKDRNKNLWIGTDGGGLTRLRDGVSSTLSGKDGLGSDYVYSIYEDREENLWVGTLHGGLFRISDSKFTTYYEREGLVHNEIHCVYESAAGDLWVGSKEGLNLLKKGPDGTFSTELSISDELLYSSVPLSGKNFVFLRNFSKKEEIISSTFMDREPAPASVTCLFEDRDGSLWIGTYGGLHLFKDGKIAGILTEKEGLSDNRITCMQGDSRGNIWVGTEAGLNRFSRHKGELTIFTTKDGLTDNFIKFVFEDSRGRLWAGTKTGLDTFKDGVFAASNPAARLEKKPFHCAYEDGLGTIWFGSGGGLFRLRGGEFKLYTVQDGLKDNYVYSILEDERGYLWLAGRKEISRIEKKELADFAVGKTHRVSPRSYNEKDGMKSSWWNGPGCKTRDGRLWFPTSMGVAVTDPNREEKKAAPTPIINRLIIDGEPVNTRDGAVEKKPLEIAPGKRRFEFYYTGMVFVNPRRIGFKIKLAGYDSDWVDMGSRRSTAYTGLSPGLYTFQVKAADAEGVWPPDSVSFSFYLRPYFSQTLWFYFLVFLSVVLTAFFSYRLRIRQLRTREKKLGRLVQQRTKDLEERNLDLDLARRNIEQSKDLIEAKSLQLESQTVQLREQSEKLLEMDKVKSRFFANISHEFRTPLTLIMGPLQQMLSSSDEKQQKKLNLMLRNAQRLLGLIDQLLALSKFESGKVQLHAVRQNIIPLLKGAVANFEPLADQNELELEFRAGEEDIELYVDAGKIEDVIYNLLINAVKFTPAGGKITVTAERIEASEEDGRAPGLSCKEKENNKKFCGGAGGGFSKEPPARRRQAGSLRISVRDTGPGIPKEQLSFIFDRFYQAEEINEQRQAGAGIGLALVKELVQLHHGKIDVYSWEGRGTEFVISLPLGEAHLAADEIVEPGEAQSLASGGQGRFLKKLPLDPAKTFVDFTGEDPDRETKEIPAKPFPSVSSVLSVAKKDIILIVEDSADMREYIRGAIEGFYDVLEAADGREGLQKARETIPDLIISDIMMPEVDGYELCRTLKNDVKTSHIPIILLTAKASEESVITGLETGADDYVTKPFSAKILTARIKNLIDLRRRLHMNIGREMTLQPAEIEVSALDKEFLKELRQVIDKNLADTEFNVEQLAKELYMDRSTVYRKVYALTGETPTDFIRTCRLKRAAELLQDNSGTVLEIAFEVGFSSANYFTKCFKAKFGRLPSEF